MDRLRSPFVRGACLAGLVVWAGTSALDFTYANPKERRLSGGYAALGEAITHGIRSHANIVSQRMPLATIVSAHLQHHSNISGPASAALFWAIIIILLYALGALLHPLGGLFSALAAVFLLNGIGDFTYYSESGYSLLVLLTACILVWRARAPSPLKSVLLALTIGATLLYRSPLAFFPPLLGFYEWGAYHRFSMRAYWRHLLILCVLPYVLLLPWIGMNWIHAGQIIPFEQGAASANIVTGALGLTHTIEGDLSTLVDPSIDIGRNGDILGWAVRETARHPLRYIRGVLRRIRFALLLSPKLTFLAVLSLVIFRRRREHQALGLLAGYFLCVHCLMSVEMIYFWPLRPLQAVLAASVMATLQARVKPNAGSIEYRLAMAVAVGALALTLSAALYASAAVLSYTMALLRSPGTVEDEFSRALLSHPDDDWLFSERGTARLIHGNTTGAAADFSMTARLLPGDPKPLLQLARASSLLGKPAMILAWKDPPGLDHADDMFRYDADILKACALIRLGRTAKAEIFLKAALDLYINRNAVVQGAHGEIEKDVLGKLRGSDTGFVSYCLTLLGDRPESETRAMSLALTKLLPGSSEAWIVQAELATQLGNRDAALRSLSVINTLTPNIHELNRVAHLYRRLREYRRAAAIVDSLIALRPEDAGLWLERGEIAVLMSEPDYAARMLAHVEKLTLSPEERGRANTLDKSLHSPRR